MGWWRGGVRGEDVDGCEEEEEEEGGAEETGVG